MLSKPHQMAITKVRGCIQMHFVKYREPSTVLLGLGLSDNHNGVLSLLINPLVTLTLKN